MPTTRLNRPRPGNANALQLVRPTLQTAAIQAALARVQTAQAGQAAGIAAVRSAFGVQEFQNTPAGRALRQLLDSIRQVQETQAAAIAGLQQAVTELNAKTAEAIDETVSYGGWLDGELNGIARLLAAASAGINVTDKPQVPMYRQAAIALDAYNDFESSGDERSRKMLDLFSSLLTMASFYVPSKGIISIFQSGDVPDVVPGTPTPTPAAQTVEDFLELLAVEHPDAAAIASEFYDGQGE